MQKGKSSKEKSANTVLKICFTNNGIRLALLVPPPYESPLQYRVRLGDHEAEIIPLRDDTRLYVTCWVSKYLLVRALFAWKPTLTGTTTSGLAPCLIIFEVTFDFVSCICIGVNFLAFVPTYLYICFVLWLTHYFEPFSTASGACFWYCHQRCFALSQARGRTRLFYGFKNRESLQSLWH